MKDNTVTSKTTREKEGYPDLCWMEIGVEKMKTAAGQNEDYTFRCVIGKETFEYKYPAKKLLKAFLQKGVRVKNSRSEGEYTFFLEYTTGILYHSLSHMGEKENIICELSSVQTMNAADQLDRALALLPEDYLPSLVARTALWADPEKDHIPVIEKNNKTREYKGVLAKHPHIRRKRANENRGKHVDEVGSEVYGIKGKEYYLDDNTYPNAQMKAALKRQSIIPKGYETCHIWENTCYDPRYHTCYANLVLLPRAIASLSDHNANIRAILKYRAFRLFGFKPDDAPEPQKPENYPKEWDDL